MINQINCNTATSLFCSDTSNKCIGTSKEKSMLLVGQMMGDYIRQNMAYQDLQRQVTLLVDGQKIGSLAVPTFHCSPSLTVVCRNLCDIFR